MGTYSVLIVNIRHGIILWLSTFTVNLQHANKLSEKDTIRRI